jgi:hypothetical protein
MDLEGDQIVGVVKVPCITSWHGVWRSPGAISSGRKTKARAPACSQFVRRNSILETAVVKGTLVAPQVWTVRTSRAWGPGRFAGDSWRCRAGARCFVDNMETVNDTPTRRDTCDPLRAVKPNMPKTRLVMESQRQAPHAPVSQPRTALSGTAASTSVQMKLQTDSAGRAPRCVLTGAHTRRAAQSSVSRHPGSSMRARHGWW